MLISVRIKLINFYQKRKSKFENKKKKKKKKKKKNTIRKLLTFRLYYFFLNYKTRLNSIETTKLRFFIFFFIKFTIFLSGSILILLVFRDQIVHVRFSFSEFHLIHTFTSVPVKKGFSSEHGGNCSETRLNNSWMA